MNGFPSTPASLGGLAARLHARWGRALAGPDLLKAVEDGSGIPPPAAGFPNPAAAQKQAAVDTIAELADLASRLDRDSAAGAYLEWHLLRFWLEDLGVLLRHCLEPLPPAELQALLIASPDLPPLPPELWQARTGGAAAALLPPVACRPAVVAIFTELDRDRDGFGAAARLDRFFLEELAARAAACPEALRPAAVELAGLQLDIFNLGVALRNAAWFHLPPDRVRGLLAASGCSRMTPAALDALAELADPRRLPREIPSLYRRTLDGAASPEMAEPRLLELLLARARRRFYALHRPGWSVAAYPVLRQVERLNRTRLAEGMRLGLAPEALRNLLVGAPYP